MSEKAKALLEKVKGAFKKLSKKVIIFAVSALVVIAAVIVIVLNNRPYAMLVTGVSSDEASSIVGLLESLGATDYKIENNDTILVPKEQVDGLKAKLLLEGYPQTGFSYSSYYDHVGALSTESERSKSWLIATQQNMSSVIRMFDNVKDAQVQIAPGEDRGYILDSGNVVDTKAYVFVTMEGTSKLTNKQANAIRSLVTHGVEGLKIDQVVITDSLGNTYGSGETAADDEASALKLRLQEEWENKIRTEVMQVLTPVFGAENVRVGVNCVVELSKSTENRTDVYLPPWAQDGSTDGAGIKGSERYDYYVGRPGEEGAGGVVGSTTNSDLPTYVEDVAEPDGTETVISGGSQIDYDNSRSEKHIENSTGVLTDCTVAVTLNSRTAQNVDLDELRRHVARAAGIHGTIDEMTGREYLDDKVSVVQMDFYEPPIVFNGGLNGTTWLLIGVAAGLLLLILLLVIFLIRRKKKKAAEEEQLEGMDELLAAVEQQQNMGQSGADVMSLQSEKNMELRKDIRQFANDNPEIAAQMIHHWLRGGEEDG